MNNNKKKLMIAGIILLTIVGISIGYAYLLSVLNITGQSKIEKATWDVHFENVNITSGSISAIKDATIDSNTTTLSYEIKLVQPGDFYEFTVDIKNSGTIDAMISEVLKTGLTQEQAKYLSYTLSYSDGTELTAKDKLVAGETERIIVRVELKKDITSDQLPSIDQNLNLSLNVTYVQADDSAKTISSFGTHSWEQIVKNVRTNNTKHYQLGDTKEVDMGSLGTHTVRIANTTTPKECATSGFSQTACGFVVEFSDIISMYVMNSSTDSYQYGHNIGGWPATEMRTYIQNTIYPALPTELQNGIIDTTVVSGHGSSDTSNFTSIDKLYLLSTKEVWGKEGTDPTVNDDTAEIETRQLDYYSELGLTSYTHSKAIKKNQDTATHWWLRSAYSSRMNNFCYVSRDGDWYNNTASSSGGVSPAFRIG